MGLTPPLSDSRRVRRRRQSRLEDARQAVRRAHSRHIHLLLLVLLAVRRVLICVGAVPREHWTARSTIHGATAVSQSPRRGRIGTEKNIFGGTYQSGEKKRGDGGKGKGKGIIVKGAQKMATIGVTETQEQGQAFWGGKDNEKQEDGCMLFATLDGELRFAFFDPIHGETKEERRRVRENATRECRKPRQTRGIRWALVLSVSSLDILHDDTIPTRGGQKKCQPHFPDKTDILTCDRTPPASGTPPEQLQMCCPYWRSFSALLCDLGRGISAKIEKSRESDQKQRFQPPSASATYFTKTTHKTHPHPHLGDGDGDIPSSEYSHSPPSSSSSHSGRSSRPCCFAAAVVAGAAAAIAPATSPLPAG